MRIALTGALISLSLAAGCGGDDDEVNNNAERYEGEEAAVARVVDAFADAGRAGEGERICEEILAAPLAANIAREAKQGCPDEIEQNLPEGKYELEIEEIELDGESATTEVVDESDNRSVFQFVKSDDEWRLLKITPAP